MGEQAVQHRQLPILPANAIRQSHIKMRVPIGWKLTLPLAATAIMFALNGCAGNGQEQLKSKGGESMIVFQASGQTVKEMPKDTLKLTPVKTEGREKRDSLLKAQINQLAKKTQNIEFEPSGRNIPLKPKEGTLADVVKETDFIGYEQLLCHAGIDGDTAKISKYKSEIRKIGKQYSEQERAEKIISNFEKIMQIK